MEQKKIFTIFGTRPEAIKMAPLIKELEKSNNIKSKVCITAQHREMLDQVLSYFKIKPDFDLNIMKSGQTLSEITSKVLLGLDNIFKVEKPDMILVHGDTSTTLSAGLSAFYNGIAIAHVEAGLRSFDKHFPFPEEINRCLTSVIADLHFAPTKKSKENLLIEGVKEKNIFITGNTVIDAMSYTIEKDYIFSNKKLNSIDFNKKVIMVTTHRRENWGSGIENICTALLNIINNNLDVEIIYLVHLNPIVRNIIFNRLGSNNRIHLLEPLDIKETHNLMSKCFMVMTDSGGIQEEAPHLGKPVLVFRDVSERPEAIEYGTVKLVGSSIGKIIKETNILLKDKDEYLKMSKAINPYGDGKASLRIMSIIEEYFGIKMNKIQEFNQ